MWDMKNLMIKNYDFDRVMLFVDWVLLKSVDFTCVLLDWCVVNRCVLMCYLLIKYDVFGWVRESVWFMRVLRVFWKAILIILLMLKVVRMLIFQCFVELITELENGDLDVKTSDMPFPVIKHLF